MVPAEEESSASWTSMAASWVILVVTFPITFSKPSNLCSTVSAFLEVVKVSGKCLPSTSPCNSLSTCTILEHVRSLHLNLHKNNITMTIITTTIATIMFSASKVNNPLGSSSASHATRGWAVAVVFVWEEQLGASLRGASRASGFHHFLRNFWDNCPVWHGESSIFWEEGTSSRHTWRPFHRFRTVRSTALHSQSWSALSLHTDTVSVRSFVLSKHCRSARLNMRSSFPFSTHSWFLWISWTPQVTALKSLVTHRFAFRSTNEKRPEYGSARVQVSGKITESASNRTAMLHNVGPQKEVTRVPDPKSAKSIRFDSKEMMLQFKGRSRNNWLQI